MAIIVEEDKQRISRGVPALFGWLIIAAIVAVGAYYLFFAAPPAVVVVPPENFAAITPLASINLNPSSVLNSAGFQALKPYVTEPTSTGPAPVGRTNPFLVP